MTRSPLAYPLNRNADADAGGAADLQTDIMRFMAILSLCLVAIFALVQSIPINPVPPVEPVSATSTPPAVPAPETVAPLETTESAANSRPQPESPAAVSLTRPRWVPRYGPDQSLEKAAQQAKEIPATSLPKEPQPPAATAPSVASTAEGFTLRFESDAALTRLVAAGRIGLYAIHGNRARRMTVSNSRISFWDASMPNTFHEMELNTVPTAVIEALGRTGAHDDGGSWGVTLPGKFKTQLENLMLEYNGGTLIITADGEIRREAP